MNSPTPTTTIRTGPDGPERPEGPVVDTVIYEVTARKYVNGSGHRVTHEQRTPVLDPKRAESRWVGYVVLTMQGSDGFPMKRELEVALAATSPQTAFVRLREAVEVLKKQAEDAKRPGIVLPSSVEMGKKISELAGVNAQARQPSFGAGR